MTMGRSDAHDDLFRSVRELCERAVGELIEAGSESPSLTGCVTTLGFIERTLVHSGAHEVEVNLAGCRALGDDQCVFGVTWLAEPRRPRDRNAD